MKLLMGLITKPSFRVSQEKKNRATLVVVGPTPVEGTEHKRIFRTMWVMASLHACYIDGLNLPK